MPITRHQSQSQRESLLSIGLLRETECKGVVVNFGEVRHCPRLTHRAEVKEFNRTNSKLAEVVVRILSPEDKGGPVDEL